MQVVSISGRYRSVLTVLVLEIQACFTATFCQTWQGDF